MFPLFRKYNVIIIFSGGIGNEIIGIDEERGDCGLE
jgi:hypothetical protein